MTAAGVEKVLWVLTVSALGFAAGGTWHPPAPGLRSPQMRPAPASPGKVDRKRLGSYAENVVTHDPFRLSRRPSAAAFGAPVPSGQPAPPPPPPKPVLRLAGIIGGPPWQAIVEGLPAHASGVVVGKGDVVGEFRVRLVTSDSVIVEGSDTTWVLTLNRGSR